MPIATLKLKANGLYTVCKPLHKEEPYWCVCVCKLKSLFSAIINQTLRRFRPTWCAKRKRANYSKTSETIFHDKSWRKREVTHPPVGCLLLMSYYKTHSCLTIKSFKTRGTVRNLVLFFLMESKINYQLAAIISDICSVHFSLIRCYFLDSCRWNLNYCYSIFFCFAQERAVKHILCSREQLAQLIHVLLCCFQNMTSVSADSTTAMRMPCASTWLEATAALVSQATRAMGRSAKVTPAG